MGLTLTCRDLGGDCDFVATGASPTEVKRAMWGHAHRAHPDAIAGLTAGMRAELERTMDEILASRSVA